LPGLLSCAVLCLQEHAQQTREHEAALAGASHLQQQLADLQQQLAETVSRFSVEQQSLREAAQQAEAAQAAAEAAAADAQQQLALARAVLAERLGQAEQEHKQQLAELQVRCWWCETVLAVVLGVIVWLYMQLLLARSYFSFITGKLSVRRGCQGDCSTQVYGDDCLWGGANICSFAAFGLPPVICVCMLLLLTRALAAYFLGLQSRHQEEVSDLRHALEDAAANSEAKAAVAVADRLAAAESGRAAAESALCQLAEEVRSSCW
jgi:hypothetical protein